eukprot:CAMPEP_0197486848 /NCGR_PEP_ID=MMETSP1311-20131121/1826_1 /TAXON_ID=464262 /ORGANISM="Genus nov. species nov., Strain RCC856" /LENGTH=149 /DNA_ID=CAMNT_0043030169 /DNA_START=138 /DNA_END=587 /DNA_ORIENTATION=+
MDVPASATNSVVEPCSGEDLVRKLEEFFMSPELMVKIGDFMHESAAKLCFVGEHTGVSENGVSASGGDTDEETEHPLENYAIFSRYGSMIEQMVEAFLSEQGADANDLYEACVIEKMDKGNNWCVCLDYLLASLDYEYFLQIAYDFYKL